MSELLKPDLFRREGSDADPEDPALLGGACSCGYVFFPMQAYGCERCGRAQLSPRALSGRGKLLASARVHMHAGKHRQAPFTVGGIALGGGPIVRPLIVDDARPFRPGDAMVSTLSPVADPDGATKLDLRFKRA